MIHHKEIKRILLRHNPFSNINERKQYKIIGIGKSQQL